MIKINRKKGILILSRCEYLYRNIKVDEKEEREIDDGDIVIKLPEHMIDEQYDYTGRTDGQNAVTIIDEINKRLNLLVKR